MAILFYKNITLLATIQTNTRPVVGDEVVIKERVYKVNKVSWIVDSTEVIATQAFIVVNVEER